MKINKDKSFEASMSVALGLGLGFFVLTSVAGVLVVGLITGYQNTVNLLREKSSMILVSGKSEVNRYLSVAERQLDYISQIVESGEVTENSGEDFTSLLLGAIAATPQITALLYINNDLELTGAERRNFETAPLFANIGGDEDLKSISDRITVKSHGTWGPLLWRQEYGETFFNYSMPVVSKGVRRGVLIALVSVRGLSEAISDMESEFGVNAFILFGQDNVLAHPIMAFGFPGLSRSNPLPKLTSFSDPVLTSIWKLKQPGFWERIIFSNDDFHTIDLGDREYVFLYQNVESYAEKPLLVGTYFQSTDLLSEIYRLKWAVGFCFLISIISAVFAAYIGRQIAQPVRRLAEGASRIYQLELASVQRIPKSVFRELNNAAGSFNTMLEGLRWFERYVPKSLVKRLIELHGNEAVETMFLDVVILFTDIEHFTMLSEEMPAPLAAEILSAHFTLVANCIEREGGTIDKYIGDSVMAMWGAPDQYDDAVDRACRAAIEIRRKISIDNAQRRAKDELPIRVRIGINSGRVIVGNIGSPGRINYTVVGDPVNVAQRLEELAKTVGTFKDDVNILVSSNARGALMTKFEFEYHGVQEVRGRREHVEVYSL